MRRQSNHTCVSTQPEAQATAEPACPDGPNERGSKAVRSKYNYVLRMSGEGIPDAWKAVQGTINADTAADCMKAAAEATSGLDADTSQRPNAVADIDDAGTRAIGGRAARPRPTQLMMASSWRWCGCRYSG